MMMAINRIRICALLAALAGCQHGAPQGASAAPPKTGVAAAAATPPAGGGSLVAEDAERGMDIETPPFRLDVTPRLHGSRDIILRSGDLVVSRDTIQVLIKSSTDVHLYLGYCDRDRHLVIFPKEGSILAMFGETTYAPSRDGRITLDDQLGPEVLYVIASRRRLDLADPELSEAMSRVRPGSASVECGAPLDQVLEKKKPVLMSRANISKKTNRTRRNSAPPDGRMSSPGQGSTPDFGRAVRVPPPADLDRGAYIMWEATGQVSAGEDRDGIVVLRYSFTHVDKLPHPEAGLAPK